MKPRRDVTPYYVSSDMAVNASISLGKIYKRRRSLGATTQPNSRYRARILHRRAARRYKLGTVRP